jgi:hypothetical protein
MAYRVFFLMLFGPSYIATNHVSSQHFISLFQEIYTYHSRVKCYHEMIFSHVSAPLHSGNQGFLLLFDSFISKLLQSARYV